jgi:hypothetical protein
MKEAIVLFSLFVGVVFFHLLFMGLKQPIAESLMFSVIITMVITGATIAASRVKGQSN